MKTVHELGSGAWQGVPGGGERAGGVSIIRLTGELTPFHSSQGALRSGLESKPKCLRATYITGILNPFRAQSLSVHYMHPYGFGVQKWKVNSVP